MTSFKVSPDSIQDLGYFIVKVYDDQKSLQKYAGIPIPVGEELHGYFRKCTTGRKLGTIGLFMKPKLPVIVHEAMHACLSVARETGFIKELGWSREYWEVEEEEEWIATLCEEIVEGIMAGLHGQSKRTLSRNPKGGDQNKRKSVKS